MLVVFETLKRHGMLVKNINPYIQLLIMYPAGSWGSTAPDLDRPKSNSAEQTPVSMAVERCLHLVHAKHRSWQTHCVVLTGGLAIALPVILETCGAKIGTFDLSVLRLLIYGLTTGIFSHLILDALTPEGIHLVPNVKLGLVPKISFFSTGGLWEKLVCTALYVANGMVLLYLIFSINILNLLTEFGKFIMRSKTVF
jgi:membrane-bound metal-dependent hydrolase YbcI (DUF457 family)